MHDPQGKPALHAGAAFNRAPVGQKQRGDQIGYGDISQQHLIVIIGKRHTKATSRLSTSAGTNIQRAEICSQVTRGKPRA